MQPRPAPNMGTHYAHIPNSASTGPRRGPTRIYREILAKVGSGPLPGQLDAVAADAFGYFGIRHADHIEKVLNRAAARWACITSKSQREDAFSGERVPLMVRHFEGVTEVRPVFKFSKSKPPPLREGETVTHFSKKSRSRLLDKCRKMRKSGLPLPFFATLTYHQNFQDARAAKRHLNAFFQRFRRLAGAEFRYIWKLEPQKRGAAHFHLALFLPADVLASLRAGMATEAGADWKRVLRGIQTAKTDAEKSPELWALRIHIGRVWAEITAAVNARPVPYTALRWNGGKPEPAAGWIGPPSDREPAAVNVEFRPSVQHELYGTNVRPCENWEAFTGYAAKYTGKTVTADQVAAAGPAWDSPGRFWGFSRNFDFAALFEGLTTYEQGDQVREMADRMNDHELATVARQCVSRIEYLIDQTPKRKRERNRIAERLSHYQRRIAAAVEKWAYNKGKISQGYYLKFQVKHGTAAEIRAEMVQMSTPADFYAAASERIREALRHIPDFPEVGLPPDSENYLTFPEKGLN